MARTQANQFGVTFSGGLVTETGPLGYPQGTCRDMDNLVIERNGSVRVRNGLVESEQTDAAAIIKRFTTGAAATDAVTLHEFPVDDTTKFLIVQVGNILHVLDIAKQNIDMFDPNGVDKGGSFANTVSGYTLNGNDEFALSSNIVALMSASTPGISNSRAASSPLQSVYGNGLLFMCSPEHGVFAIRYMPNGRVEFEGDWFSPNSNDYNSSEEVPDNSPAFHLLPIVAERS